MEVVKIYFIFEFHSCFKILKDRSFHNVQRLIITVGVANTALSVKSF